MAVNKVVFSGNTLIDITDTTATASDVASGKYFYTNAGVRTQGTASGGGGLNIQMYDGYDYVRSSSYSATEVSLTVEVSGTYNITWTGWKSTSSGTSGSRLYINDSAYGSAYTSFTGTYGQCITLTGISLSAGDTLTVYARSRSSSYYMYIANLIITQTA